MNTLSAEEIDKNLKSLDKRITIDTLMYACFNLDDPEYIQDKCVELIGTTCDPDIRGLAITCLGHVARMHGTINRKKIIPLLGRLIQENDLSGRAQDALDDIDTFTKT